MWKETVLDVPCPLVSRMRVFVIGILSNWVSTQVINDRLQCMGIMLSIPYLSLHHSSNETWPVGSCHVLGHWYSQSSGLVFGDATYQLSRFLHSPYSHDIDFPHCCSTHKSKQTNGKWIPSARKVQTLQRTMSTWRTAHTKWWAAWCCSLLWSFPLTSWLCAYRIFFASQTVDAMTVTDLDEPAMTRFSEESPNPPADDPVTSPLIVRENNVDAENGAHEMVSCLVLFFALIFSSHFVAVCLPHFLRVTDCWLFDCLMVWWFDGLMVWWFDGLIVWLFDCLSLIN